MTVFASSIIFFRSNLVTHFHDDTASQSLCTLYSLYIFQVSLHFGSHTLPASPKRNKVDTIRQTCQTVFETDSNTCSITIPTKSYRMIRLLISSKCLVIFLRFICLSQIFCIFRFQFCPVTTCSNHKSQSKKRNNYFIQ